MPSPASTADETLRAAGHDVGGTVIAARVDGELRDLATEVTADAVVEPVVIDSADGRAILRHSTAHVLAQAVQELFPQARLGIGPPIDNGFYYDFDVPEPFHPDDLERLEKRMQQIVKERQAFVRRAVSDDEARAELAAEPYKLELIGLKGGAGDSEASVEVGGDQLTIYDNVRSDGTLAWKDLCRGPHLPTTRNIPAFKLMRVAAAYWRGNEHNRQLQRIYGTAWESRDALKAHLEFLKEAASVPTSTCSRSRRRSVRDFRSSIRKAASFARSWRTTRASGTRKPAICSSTARTSPRSSCSRSPGTSAGTARACSRRWSSKARSTTSSR